MKNKSGSIIPSPKASVVARSLGPLIKQVRALVLCARRAAAASVNTLQVLTNFEIGRLIVEHEQQGHRRAGYGELVIRTLSDKLTAEFGRGFSKANLEYMRRFYLIWNDRPIQIAQKASGQSPRIPQTLSAQSPTAEICQSASDKLSPIAEKPSGQLKAAIISQALPDQLPANSGIYPRKSDALSVPFTLSWSHYVVLMGIKDERERCFYEIESAQSGWSVPELKRQLNSGLYERLVLSRDKKRVRKLAEEGQAVARPVDMIKDPYVLEFLGLEEKTVYSESDLESAIIDKLQHFLLELGKGFLFESRQKRFTFGEDHFFVDLVFYNRLLRCYVLLDLKIGKLTHQDLGQMQMYVNYFDRYVKSPDEHPTVGIILCKKKHDALVEITLPKNANIFTSAYQLYLPSKEDLRQRLLEWTRTENVP